MKKLLGVFTTIILSLLVLATPAFAATNLALNKTITASSQKTGYEAVKVGDGNRESYWESAGYDFPSNITVDLGTTYQVNSVTLKSPTAWGISENITIQGSTDNVTYTTLVPATSYSISVTPINFSTVSERYIRVVVNSNVYSPAGQLSELEIYGPNSNWPIESMDVMKYSKDAVCSLPSDTTITTMAQRAKDSGASYIAISTPYDDPTCGSALTLTNKWITATRAQGLKVWHRHMGLSFEGIYSTTKSKALNGYIQQIVGYIYMNPGQFQDGDIFTPTPEPDSAGINGVTYCGSPAYCQFSSASEYNLWIQKTQTAVKAAFTGIGKNVKVGYYGHSGFIVWGENNPDWSGIGFLTQATVDSMDGVITMDTYPESYGGTMAASLNGAHAKWPNATIVIGEWGAITATNSAQATSQINTSLGAAKQSSRSWVGGVNYWNLGPSGNEGLLNNDLTTKSQFDDLTAFFKGLR